MVYHFRMPNQDQNCSSWSSPRVALKAGEMAPLVRCLPCELKDWSLIPSSYGQYLQYWRKAQHCGLCLLSLLGRWRQNPWGSLCCQWVPGWWWWLFLFKVNCTWGIGLHMRIHVVPCTCIGYRQLQKTISWKSWSNYQEGNTLYPQKLCRKR
jgi:hypothetical protein